MSTEHMCPNCVQLIDGHPQNSCVLAAFIALLKDRENLTAEALLELHRNVDIDALWDALGPVLDTLEAGGFTPEQ